MKEDDKVYVNWPTGKTGPHYVEKISGTGWVIINYETQEVPVDPDWCEPAESEIEEGRLVYATDTVGTSAGWFNKKLKRGYTVKERKDDKYGLWFESVKPVHRRWNELTDEEKKKFARYLFHLTDREFTIVEADAVYRKVYYIITGEKHP